MLGGRSNDEWIRQYAGSHQHPVNRFCHTVGIPMIVASLVLVAAAFILGVASYAFRHFAFFVRPLAGLAVGLFILGWIFQFIGHAFEGKSPEFFHDWRFLMVGVRWWLAKMRGKA